MKTEYVLGFIFSEDGENVVLIRKNKPDWQKGKLNGIGGKIEPGETPIQAMEREAVEECGVSPLWFHYCVMTGEFFTIQCYKAFNNAAFDSARTIEAEKIVRVRCRDISKVDWISNLPWLIWMALDNNNGNSETPFFARVNYNKGLS